jgi:hypothetical protein
MPRNGNPGGKDRYETDLAVIQLSPLYHAPWIDSTRHTTVGGLALGYDFVWGDMFCYAVGIGLGILIGWIARHDRSAPGV